MKFYIHDVKVGIRYWSINLFTTGTYVLGRLDFMLRILEIYKQMS